MADYACSVIYAHHITEIYKRVEQILLSTLFLAGYMLMAGLIVLNVVIARVCLPDIQRRLQKVNGSLV